jgi:hypothetical protein
LRHRFYSKPQAEVLLALGEGPEEYLAVIVSLREDLQPRLWLECQSVAQSGETLRWVRRLWCLANSVMKARQYGLNPKVVENDDRPGYVCEGKRVRD